MVLAERTSDNLRNGRRSRGPSPNGIASDSSGDDVDGVPEEKIRVGRDFQAVVPELISIENRRPDQCIDRALLVWSPSINIQDSSLDEYISLAKEKYGYNGEQALGMLFWHKHNLERAIRDLANFTPFPDEWTVEDKVLFEQAFQFHGKSFHRIRQMLPEMTIACLVKYYYSWKKTRTRTSLMDRQARKLASHRDEGSEGGSEHGSNTDSDSEEKVKLSGEKGNSVESNAGGNKGGLRRDFLLSNAEKANQAKLATERNMKNLRVSEWDGKNVVGNCSVSEVSKRKFSPSAAETKDLVTSPNKRRLLSMPAPKSVKLNRAALRKSDAALNSKAAAEGVKNEIESLKEDNPVVVNSTDNTKPGVQISPSI